MPRRVIFSLFSIFLVGCGDTALDSYNSGKDNTYSLPEYIIIMPTNPPFIDFGDENLGEIDDFKYDEDVEFPTEPIPQVPDIL
jgi:hypothetical protein